MAVFAFHLLGVNLRSVFITLKPLWILMMKPIRRFVSGGQNGNAGLHEFQDAGTDVGGEAVAIRQAETCCGDGVPEAQ